MKLNSGGLKLCAVYLVFVILMLTWVHFTSDPKAHFWQATLAWLPGHLMLAPFGPRLYQFMWNHLWAEALIPTTSFLIVYLVGWGISALKRMMP